MSEPVRAVVAMSNFRKLAIVLATNSPTLAFDLEEISNNTSDVGLEDPPAPGVWLYEGAVTRGAYHVSDGHYEPELVYEGTYRLIRTDDELADLMELSPPKEPEPEERESA